MKREAFVVSLCLLLGACGVAQPGPAHPTSVPTASDPYVATVPPDGAYVSFVVGYSTGDLACPRPLLTMSIRPFYPAIVETDGGFKWEVFRLELDGRDITEKAAGVDMLTAAGLAQFSYEPEEPLEVGWHQMSVSFPDVSGKTVRYTWRFQVGDVECDWG